MQHQRAVATFAGPAFAFPFVQITRFDLGKFYQYQIVRGTPSDCIERNMTGRLPVFFAFPPNATYTGTAKVAGVECDWCVGTHVCCAVSQASK